ncbi:hypothetical protein [Methylobacterium sp. ID0610]|uniref:hypothetical protein n=1 Tax=Methylobacterium carpenticola TaxID=3344827 RepID=UPI0036C06C8A
MFDCAVALRSERLITLLGNDQARFEVDGIRQPEGEDATKYGGKTVTVVMIYDPTEEA